MPCGGVAVSGRPSNRMRPSLKLYRRDRQLNSVVLPAPFGPIRPVMSPASTENDTPVQRRDPAKTHSHADNVEEG